MKIDFGVEHLKPIGLSDLKVGQVVFQKRKKVQAIYSCGKYEREIVSYDDYVFEVLSLPKKLHRGLKIDVVVYEGEGEDKPIEKTLFFNGIGDEGLFELSNDIAMLYRL